MPSAFVVPKRVASSRPLVNVARHATRRSVIAKAGVGIEKAS